MDQVEVYLQANKTDQAVKVVIVYSAAETAKVARAFPQLDAAHGLNAGTTASQVVAVDAR